VDQATELLGRLHTDLTLWEHDMTRRLASCSLEQLREALNPDLCVRVVEIRGTLGPASFFHPDSSKLPPTVLMAQCQILSDDGVVDVDGDSVGGKSDPALLGTIIFSLNCHPKRTDGVPRASAKGPLIISNPVDLARYVSRAAEVWIWQPWTEVPLGGQEGAEESGQVRKALICSRFGVPRQ
jgi:hypothetical protein